MRYFFHIDDVRHLIDTDGVELPDEAAARREALRVAGELMIDDAAREIWAGPEWLMTVVDEAGRRVFTLRFSAGEPQDRSQERPRKRG